MFGDDRDGYVYIVYDADNRQRETFAGPLRLAAWLRRGPLPTGWTIERIHAAISPTLPGVRVTTEEVLALVCAE